MSARLTPRSLPFLLCLFALALPLAAPAARFNPTVKFELEDGAKVSDMTTVIVKAATPDDSGIDKVEFYVDNQLKFTDTSTPYEFAWDTLAETEGAHALKAVAFDSKGNTATAKINVAIDNELGKGAEAHAASAAAALKEGNVDLAAKYARRALKIDPENLAASRAYAGVLRQRGQLAEAVDVLDKAKIADDDVATRVDLMALHMAKADAADSTEDFLKEANTALDIYKKVHDLRLKSAGTEPVARGDELMAGRQWVLADQQYQKCGAADEAPAACVNRRALALIMAGRSKDADSVLRTLIRNKHADQNTQALVGLLAMSSHDYKKAREAVQDGVEAKNVAALIVAAYSDLASKQMAKARDEAEAANSIAPDSADVQLLRSYLLADDVEAKRAFVRALELNPMLAEAYTQRAFHVMLERDVKRFQAADQLLEMAAKIDPENRYTMMGRAVSFLGQRRPNEAEPLLNTLLEQDKNAPDVYVASALTDSLLDKTLKITEKLNTALKLDPDRWTDVFVLKPNDLIARVYRYRYPPFVMPSSLAK